jgi:hypothetical protein
LNRNKIINNNGYYDIACKFIKITHNMSANTNVKAVSLF